MNSSVKISAKVYFLIALAITISVAQFYFYKKSQERQSLLNQFFIVSSRIKNETSILKSQVLFSYFENNEGNIAKLFNENIKTINFARNLITKYDIISNKKNDFLQILNQLYDSNIFAFEQYLSLTNKDKDNLFLIVNYLDTNYEALSKLTKDLISYTDSIGKKYERANLLFSFASVILIISILSFVIVPQILELEKLNQDINASNLLRKAIQESSPNAIMFINNQYKIQLLNNKAKDIIRILTGKNISEGEELKNVFLSEDLRQFFLKNIGESKENKFSHDHISTSHTNPQHYKVLFYSVFTDRIYFSGTTVIFSDVTNEIVSKQRLKKSESYFKTLVEKSHGVIFSLDHLLNIKYASSSIEFYSKFKAKNFIGRPFLELISPRDKEKILSFLVEKINEESTDNTITFSINGMSREVIFLCKCGVIDNEETNSKELILSCLDITDRIQSEKKLQEHNKKLREIAWIQSHVVRKPVANVLGLLQLLQTQNEQGNEIPKDLLPNTAEIIGLFRREILAIDEIIHQIDEKTKEI